MIAKIKKLFQLIKYLGFPWLLFRVYYFFKKKSRFLIWQMPCSSWDSNKEKFSDWQENKANFFFNSLDNSFPKKEMLQKADDILNGYFYYFSCHNYMVYFFTWFNKIFILVMLSNLL